MSEPPIYESTTARQARRPTTHLLRAEDAATILQVRPSWIYEAVRTHRLPCVRVGRHIRFTHDMLDQWIAENTTV